MQEWQYVTIHIAYDKKCKDWVIEYADRNPVAGLQTILNSYGTQGWELVNLQAENFEAFAGLGKYIVQPAAYRATFKRPIDS